MSQPTVTIRGRRLGADHPTYVIAELSANHGGTLERALELVGEAARCGADAVKLQTYTPESMTLPIDRPPFVVGEGSPWTGRQLFDLYREAHTPREWHGPLFEAAAAAKIDCFSTPFDPAAVEFLEAFDPPAYKIASFEIEDRDLIAAVAATGKPVIISTGMATDDEIAAALETARQAGTGQIAVLRCNSAYPASPSEMDLRTIPAIARRWDVVVGLSDHTLGNVSSLVSIALGARIIEKHLTFSRADGGPDAAFSCEPAELRALVDEIREAEASLGAERFGPSPSEQSSLAFRRSLWFVRDVEAGSAIASADIAALRPAGGLPPHLLRSMVGRRVRASVKRGDPVVSEVVEDAPDS